MLLKMVPGQLGLCPHYMKYAFDHGPWSARALASESISTSLSTLLNFNTLDLGNKYIFLL